MSENVVLLIANIIVIVAWVGCALFVVTYAFGSPWRSTLAGRTIMYSKMAMLALLTYALTARWIEPADEVNYAIALATYAGIAAVQWRLYATLRYVQAGKVTLDKPNYTPVRDWWKRRMRKREDRR